MKTQNEELKEILIKHNALNKTMEEVEIGRAHV